MGKKIFYVTKFTEHEKKIIDGLCKAERLKKSTYLNRVIENELDTFDKKNPDGYFVNFLKEKNSLRLSKVETISVSFSVEVHNKLEEICNKTDWSKQYLVRLLILPTLLFYEEDENTL